MDLDRNIDPEGCGKYALLHLRRLNALRGEFLGTLPRNIAGALETLEKAGVIEWGRKGEPDEFFLIKLRDTNAPDALMAYAKAARENGDPQFGGAVWDLAARAGKMSPHCKQPD